MTSDKAPDSQSKRPALDASARRRGRLGLAIPFESIPWWGVIILIVGIIVGYSVLNNVRYVDALYFIFDLPWDRDVIGRTDIEAEEAETRGEWSYTFKKAIDPGVYTVYIEFQDEEEEPLGRSEAYRFKALADAPELDDDQDPELVPPSETPVKLESSTPTLVGTATPPATVMLYDVRYTEILYTLFDLVWSKEAVGQATIAEDGEWSVTIEPGLELGDYTFYAEFLDGNDQVVGRSNTYRINVVDGVPDAGTEPVTTVTDPTHTVAQVHTNTPTIGGNAAPVKAVVVDDFHDSPVRIFKRMWRAGGVFLTIRVTLVAFVSALLIGLVFGLMRVSSRSPDLFTKFGWRLLIGVGVIVLLLIAVPSLRTLPSMALTAFIVEVFMFLLPAMPYTISTLYVEVIRGVPMLVIVLYMGFAVTPALRNISENWPTGEINLQGLPAAIIGLAFGYGAYLAEIYRAGIESIPRGQAEAARSLGMSYFQAMRYVILPQAIRVVLPPLGNDFIAMLKDSSLISVVALEEILQQGRLWISRNFRAFEGFNSVALLYLLMTLMLSLFVRVVERKASLPGR